MSATTLVLSRERLAKYPDFLLTMMADDVGGDTLDVPEDDAHRFRLVGGVYRCGARLHAEELEELKYRGQICDE